MQYILDQILISAHSLSTIEWTYRYQKVANSHARVVSERCQKAKKSRSCSWELLWGTA